MDNRTYYDVFLSHNSKDKQQVLLVSKHLQSQGFTTWIDKENIYGGGSLSSEIREAIYYSRTAAFFIGRHGLGEWQKDELKILSNRRIKKKIELIPILLPGVDELPDEPDFISLEEIKYFLFCSDDMTSSKDTNSLFELSRSVRRYSNEWADKEIKKLSSEKKQAEEKLREIERDIKELEAQLVSEEDQERKQVLDWLLSRRNENTIKKCAEKTLQKFPSIVRLVSEKKDGLSRFCSDLDTCLEFVFFAFKRQQTTFLYQLSIALFLPECSLPAKDIKNVYKEAFAFVESNVPEALSDATKNELKNYFRCLNDQLSTLI